MDRLAAVTFLPGVKWGKGVAITLLTQMSRLFQSSNQPSHSQISDGLPWLSSPGRPEKTGCRWFTHCERARRMHSRESGSAVVRDLIGHQVHKHVLPKASSAFPRRHCLDQRP